MKRSSKLKVGGVLLILAIVALVYILTAPPTMSSEVFSSSRYTIHTEHTVSLADGRILGYAEYGDPLGFPVLYFHGGQESRLSSNFMDSIAAALALRIIAPDRPGIGLSSFQKERTFLNWSKDVAELADSLKLEKFSVFGLSGGAPHVLACAYAFPHRLERVTIVSGTAPHTYKGKLRGMWFPVKLMHWFAAAKTDNYLRKFITSEHKTLKESPEKRLRQLQRYLPKPDSKLLTEKPQYGISFIQGSQEAYKNGTAAVIQEWKMYVDDWGFPLEDISTHINLWYGSEDKMTPKYRGMYLHKILPDSELHILENEGHFSLIRNHLKLLLTQLKPKI
ncbi:MAG: alpha/beta hydrolase [Maribacter sp.]|uniref:alpha/beta fold hydrolase n=1 Tax=Maribacter sp. TaxID=1897614 RepID=UPI0032982401